VYNTKAERIPGLNIMVPGSNGSEGKTNEALISDKLISEKIDDKKIVLSSIPRTTYMWTSTLMEK